MARLDGIPPSNELVFLHETVVPARSHTVASGPHHHETGQLATRVPLGALTSARVRCWRQILGPRGSVLAYSHLSTLE